MEPGARSQEFDASLLASEFLTLRPAKNMSKQPFSKKMSELRMLLRIARVQSTKQSVGSINGKLNLKNHKMRFLSNKTAPAVANKIRPRI